MSIQTPKGTRDFFPEEMSIQNYLFQNWKKNALNHGYEEYDSPAFEDLNLYKLKSGDEIVSQLYHFKDKGERELALRPEMTPTLARMVSQKLSSLKLPLRWFSIPRLHRYERSQKGRLREFFQLNMDIIGCDGIWAEVDLLVCVIDLLKRFGLGSNDFYIGISDRRLFEALFQSLGLKEIEFEKLYGILDKKSKLTKEIFEQELKKLELDDSQIGQLQQFFECKSIQDLKNFSRAIEVQLEELERVISSFEKIGLSEFIRLDLSVVRGLAYYTGIIFEVFDLKKNMRAIAGGGRYANLCGQLGKQEVTGVGFGMGDVVLADLLKENELLQHNVKSLDYYIISLGQVNSEIFSLAMQLRKKGLKVSCVLTDRKLKRQLSLAEFSGAQKVIFYCLQRAEKNQYEVKYLQTGKQEILSLEQL